MTHRILKCETNSLYIMPQACVAVADAGVFASISMRGQFRF